MHLVLVTVRSSTSGAVQTFDLWSTLRIGSGEDDDVHVPARHGVIRRHVEIRARGLNTEGVSTVVGKAVRAVTVRAQLGPPAVVLGDFILASGDMLVVGDVEVQIVDPSLSDQRRISARIERSRTAIRSRPSTAVAPHPQCGGRARLVMRCAVPASNLRGDHVISKVATQIGGATADLVLPHDSAPTAPSHLSSLVTGEWRFIPGADVGGITTNGVRSRGRISVAAPAEIQIGVHRLLLVHEAWEHDRPVVDARSLVVLGLLLALGRIEWATAEDALHRHVDRHQSVAQALNNSDALVPRDWVAADVLALDPRALARARAEKRTYVLVERIMQFAERA